MNQIKLELSKILSKILKNLYDVDFLDIELGLPPKGNTGDYAFSPFALSKELKKSPHQISSEIKNYIENKNIDIFIYLDVIGPYLNFSVDYSVYTEIFLNSDVNIEQIGDGETIIVDYIGANMGKLLHIGHMCTPNQGQATINLYRKLGYHVISDSHLGDWGIIFGKLIYAYKTWGDSRELELDGVEYLHKLYMKASSDDSDELKQSFRDEFKLLSSGDKDSIDIWTNFKKYSLISMNKSLGKLHIKPNYNIGESFYEGLDLPKSENYPDLKYSMSDIVDELISLDIATKNPDNSVGIVFSDESKIPSTMLQKTDGTHGYLRSDLRAVRYRVDNWSPTKIIYHIDSRQSLHFKQVFEISSMASWISKDSLVFAGNGFIKLKSGVMSSRKGNIIKLDVLIDEAISRARSILLEKNSNISSDEISYISEIIGIGSLKYSYLSKSRDSDMVFDWDEALSYEGNSFPYIAYSILRAKNILKNSKRDIDGIERFKNISIFYDKTQIDLFNLISDLNIVLQKVAIDLYHHNLTLYSYNLAKVFSRYYDSVNILSLDSEDEIILNLKLVLDYIETQEIIFEILAIKLPDQM